MIYTLRKKMIWICGSSVVGVFTLIFIIINLLGNRQLNANMDMMTDRISQGNGVFLPVGKENALRPGTDQYPGYFTEETPFSTRFFTVWVDENGKVTGENVNSVSSVTKEQAHAYAAAALREGKGRGWADNFRYKIFDTARGRGIVFVDGSASRFLTRTMMFISGMVLIVSMVIILILIIVLSKRVVRPIAQSYEKQKQFITDANHELKTPLTLILTNLDIVESELGHSEWIDDIRIEGQRMSNLVGQLTAMSRLDEEGTPMPTGEFSLSDVCSDTVSEFGPLAEGRGLTVTADIQPDIVFRGDEAAIRRLVAILLDNAVKYCDPAGTIYLSATAKWQTVIAVENTCAAVDALELDRLFDRFYRADKARTAGNSFGIGLSLAKAIAQKHHGDIRAYKAGPGKIGFRVTMK